jgi:sulfur relay (sulfurtransferase) DsrF/TusC family protein
MATEQTEAPTQLLVESQAPRDLAPGSGFLRAAWHLAAGGTPTVVLLIDDGVAAATGGRPDVADVVAAGGRVWADEASLEQRAIPVAQLSPGVEAVDLDKVTPLLVGPDVRVVWH